MPQDLTGHRDECKCAPGHLVQVGLALAYYATLVTIMRLAGKRLAGQTTTFDLVILIISVVLQTTVLRESPSGDSPTLWKY